MAIKNCFLLVLLSIFSGNFKACADVDDQNNLNTDSTISSFEFSNHLSFNALSASRRFGFNNKARSSESPKEAILNKEEKGDSAISAKPHKQPVKLHLKRWSLWQKTESKTYALDSRTRDLAKIQILHRRVTEKKNETTMSRLQKRRKQPHYLYKPPVASAESSADEFSDQLMGTLVSGSSFGSGEYFMDVFVGTPPKHFWLILDTGSDLNWIQCLPCYDCFEQNGPHYDPKDSTSFQNISCHDPRCQMVSSPYPSQPCKTENQPCPYFYWYGDGSNTTGDFALEAFSVNFNSHSRQQVGDVMFGCGHWNRGLFRGAAGLLGLGRGPLSFSSQLQSIYGHSFSYCLVDLSSSTSISSKLIFGEEKELLIPNMNFTSLGSGKDNQDDTFYYLQIKSIIVGGEVLEIPEKTWHISSEGAGGTVIDSGTTLAYFPNPAYDIIKEAFRKKIKLPPIAKDDDLTLALCYNVSGVQKMELPEFGIQFADGSVWNYHAENYLYLYEPDKILCLAILETPHSPFTIIGNHLQQNFYILYDTKKSRLGYSSMKCADF